LILQSDCSPRCLGCICQPSCATGVAAGDIPNCSMRLDMAEHRLCERLTVLCVYCLSCPAESLHSSSPTSSHMSSESPTAAQQHQKQQQQRRPYKVHGMDPYDYW
jgi:hypothetical protein